MPNRSGVPDDVPYTILDEQTLPGVKRTLDIRLSRAASKEELRSLALRLKESDPANYERTFIGYYLPGMEINAGYWATTHFDPYLEVRILGLPGEQQDSAKPDEDDESVQIVGKWADHIPVLANTTVILVRDGKPYMENRYRDGSTGKHELVESRSPLGRRFDKVSGSQAGDHWIIDSVGNLQIRDDEGLIRMLEKMEE